LITIYSSTSGLSLSNPSSLSNLPSSGSDSQFGSGPVVLIESGTGELLLYDDRHVGPPFSSGGAKLHGCRIGRLVLIGRCELPYDDHR